MIDPADRTRARWLFELFYFEPDTEAATADQDLDQQLARIYRRLDVRARQRARRRARWIGAFGAGAIVAGGATAAAFLHSEQASRPEAGTTCRAEPTLDGDAFELGPGAKPIEGCADAWAAGRLGSGTVPALIACIDRGGAIDVFPGDAGVCQALGLAVADTNPSAATEEALAVEDRINELNAAACQPSTAVVEHVRAILAGSGLEGWQVDVMPGADEATCAKAALDSLALTVRVFAVPGPPPDG